MAGYKHHQQIRLGCLFKQATVDRLERYAKQNDVSLTEVIRQAVERFLDATASIN